MITEKVLKILSLPKTLLIGNLSRVYNDYTLFLPYQPGMKYEYTLITSLSFFEKQRIRLNVPCNETETYICTQLLNKKDVFALQSAALPGMIVIPDQTTHLITKNMVTAYPFATMYVPEGAKITPLAAEESIDFKECKLCELEKYAEVFGQQKKQMN